MNLWGQFKQSMAERERGGGCIGLWGGRGIIRPQFWLNMASHRPVFCVERTYSERVGEGDIDTVCGYIPNG